MSNNTTPKNDSTPKVNTFAEDFAALMSAHNVVAIVKASGKGNRTVQDAVSCAVKGRQATIFLPNVGDDVKDAINTLAARDDSNVSTFTFTDTRKTVKTSIIDYIPGALRNRLIALHKDNPTLSGKLNIILTRWDSHDDDGNIIVSDDTSPNVVLVTYSA